MEITRVKNDVNGNGRYVVHFLDCCTREELDANTPAKYESALHRMRKIGGRKFHNRQYGGGIIFQEPAGPDQLRADIEKLTGRAAERLAAEKKAADRERLADAAPAMLAALRGLLARAGALDQSATHDGLQNCDALRAARAAVESAGGAA